MGERRLGEQPIQESWDLALGTHQRALIELGYEGVSIEQVLEQRLRRAALRPRRRPRRSSWRRSRTRLVYLRSRRLADELGGRALDVLAAERSVDGAPEVLRRARRLLAYYRTSEPALPPWIESFVKAGYAHYCTLLPTAFADDDATVRQVAAMLGFLFSMESLALSLGCDRTQLELAVAQSHPEDPAKTALLWAARTQLGQLSRADLRARCDELLGNPLVRARLPALPQRLRPRPRAGPGPRRLRRGGGVQRVRAAARPGAAALAADSYHHPAFGRCRAGATADPRGRADLPRPAPGPGRVGPAVAGPAGAGTTATGAERGQRTGASRCSPPIPPPVTRWRTCWAATSRGRRHPAWPWPSVIPTRPLPWGNCLRAVG